MTIFFFVVTSWALFRFPASGKALHIHHLRWRNPLANLISPLLSEPHAVRLHKRFQLQDFTHPMDHFSKFSDSTTKRMLKSTDQFLESSRRRGFHLGTPLQSNQAMKIGPGGGGILRKLLPPEGQGTRAGRGDGLKNAGSIVRAR